MTRSKKSRKGNIFGIEVSRSSPQATFSVVVFVVSALVFVHQCVIPLTPSTLRSLSKLQPTRSHHRYQPPTLSYTQTKKRSVYEEEDGDPTSDSIESSSLQVFNPSTIHHQVSQIQPQKSVTTTKSLPSPVPPISAETAKNNLDKIPKGPYPLPPISQKRGATVQSGSTWSVSLARGLMSTLPAHWVAEVSRKASAFAGGISSPFSSGAGTNDGSSIFTARQKGEWIGCTRPHHLVCKGVYRAIKAHNSLSILSLSCSADVAWLPHILRKLRTELRPVRLYCAISPPSEDPGAAIRKTDIEKIYKGNAGLAGFLSVPNLQQGGFIMEDSLLNIGEKRIGEQENQKFKVDMIVIYRRLASMTLINGVKFLRSVKVSGVADLLVSETFPEADNAVSVVSGIGSTGRNKVNVGAAPFFFPAPVFEYVNEEESAASSGGTDEMEIVVINTADLFAERMTPEMKDLVDPRKRVVLE